MRSEPDSEPKILHPMESFGSVSGLAEGIRVNRLQDRLDPLVPFPHKHDFYQLLFVEKGRGQHRIDFERYPVRKGSVFIMQPAQVHSWTLSDDTAGFVIELNKETLQSKDLRWQQIKQLLDTLPAAPTTKAGVYAEIITHCQVAYAEFDARKPHFELMLLTRLIAILVLLHRENPESLPRVDSSLHDAFLQLLELHFRENHRVNFYASQLGLTSKALTMRFHRLGLPAPRDLIQDRCLIEAKRLLVYSSYTIQDIAEKLGFEDPNYFARFFRLQTRQSPGSFRKEAGRLC